MIYYSRRVFSPNKHTLMDNLSSTRTTTTTTTTTPHQHPVAMVAPIVSYSEMSGTYVHLSRTISAQRQRLDTIVASSISFSRTNAPTAFPIYFSSRQLRNQFPNQFRSTEVIQNHHTPSQPECVSDDEDANLYVFSDDEDDDLYT